MNTNQAGTQVIMKYWALSAAVLGGICFLAASSSVQSAITQPAIIGTRWVSICLNIAATFLSLSLFAGGIVFLRFNDEKGRTILKAAALTAIFLTLLNVLYLVVLMTNPNTLPAYLEAVRANPPEGMDANRISYFTHLMLRATYLVGFSTATIQAIYNLSLFTVMAVRRQEKFAANQTLQDSIAGT